MALINSVELDMHSLYIDQAEALLSQRREAVQEESSRIQKLTCKIYTSLDFDGKMFDSYFFPNIMLELYNVI